MFKVRIYRADGAYMDSQQHADEIEARAAAAAIGTVQGQKSWTCHIWHQGKRVASYRGGREFTPNPRKN